MRRSSLICHPLRSPSSTLLFHSCSALYKSLHYIYSVFFSPAFGTQGDTFLQILTKWSTGRTGCKHEALDFMHAAIPLCPVFQTKWWIVSEKKYEVLRVATILHTKKPLFSSPFMNLNTRCIFLSDRTMESGRCLESFILPKLITSSI